MVQEVDDKTLDMRTVVILVGHDHKVTVSEGIGRRVVVVVLQTQNLLDVLDFLVLHDLVVACLTDVEELTTKREDAESVTALNCTDAGHCHRLGGVSFRQDQSALARVAATRPVCVIKLGDSPDTGTLRSVGLLHGLVLLELGESEDILDDAGLGDLLDKLLRQLALGAESRRLKSKGLLRLGVERRVLNQRVHEDPHVALDLERLDLGGLVLFGDKRLPSGQLYPSSTTLTACLRAE